jgi:predicted transcriptional regulator
LTIGLRSFRLDGLSTWGHLVKKFDRPFLGELELATLEEIWERGPLDVKGVHQTIGLERGIAPNTVQSTLERLYRKALLQRDKVSHAYVYSPAVSRNELMEQLIGEVVDTFASGRSDTVLTAFVDLAARIDEQSLSRLEDLIARRREQGGGSEA